MLLTSSTSFYWRECPDVAIKVAASREERAGAFRLAYQSYLRAELCGPSPSGMRVTSHQLLPSTDIIIAELHGEVISTLSLVRDGEGGLPIEAVYPREVLTRRAKGLRLAEVSCLADRREGAARFFGLFTELSRLMVQLADDEGIDELLIAVHPRHARMYRRAMGFTQVGENRDYPAVNGRPAVALSLVLDDVRLRQPAIWQRFVGAPLPKGVVSSRPMSLADRKYFAEAALVAQAKAAVAPELAFAFDPTSLLTLSAV